MYLAMVSTATNGNKRYQRYKDIYREPLTAVSSLSGGRIGKEKSWQKNQKKNMGTV